MVSSSCAYSTTGQGRGARDHTPAIVSATYTRFHSTGVEYSSQRNHYSLIINRTQARWYTLVLKSGIGFTLYLPVHSEQAC